MSFLSITFTVLFYAATLTLFAGLAFKIHQYWTTPAPLKIPITPAPTTQTGVVFRMTREILLFESLFKANKWIWFFGFLFHFGMLLAVLRHVQYFTQPVWSWVIFIQPLGKYASFAMLVGLTGLLVRRFAVDRIRYISSPSDFFMLILFLVITLTGTLMTLVGYVDVIQLKHFFMGLIKFDLQNLPSNSVILIVHLSCIVLLMFIFPFSKLLHAPAVFFSPTRNQVDNAREKRFAAH